MAKKDYLEWDVVDRLKRKQDLKIRGKQIAELANGKGDVGIKSKGKIDFLVNYLGYYHFFLSAPEFRDFQ